MSTPQLKVWEGQFGNDYTDRTVVNMALRAKTFSQILEGLYIYRALEVGCGKGDNLQALKSLVQQIYGLDPNKYAVELAKARGLWVQRGNCFKIPAPNMNFDLVLTVGVLMHVSSADLPRAVAEVCRVCRHYLLVVEYSSSTEIAIDYRGKKELLWKRDYSKIIPGKLIRTTFLSKADSGFDDCTAWLWDVTA